MQIDVEQEARAILDNTEDHASMIERTAKAIMKSHRIAIGYPGRPLRDDTPAWERHWNSLASGVRIVYRNQARAALAASELLERVDELERRINAARAECVIYGGELDGPSLARKVNRVDRILAKPTPDPEPMGVKSKP